MKVGYNLLGLPSLKQGGTGFYAEMLIHGLSRRDELEVNVLCNATVGAELEEASGAARVVVARDARQSRLARGLDLAGSLRDPLRYADGHDPVTGEWTTGCDLVHYPLSFMTGPPHRQPKLLTTADLQHLEHPAFFSRQDLVLRRIRWHRALRVADRVITHSEYSRRTIVERIGVPEDRVDVVPHACNPRFLSPPTGSGPDLGKFVIYPAAPLPAKNHERLVRAFALLAKEYAGLTLALCGPTLHDWSRVEAVVRRHDLEGRVTFLGHLPLSRLVDHYADACAMVFPSLYEGFGLPLIEAMAAGCPVAAADVASIPEVTAGHARLFDPLKEEAIADGIRELLDMTAAERAERTSAARRHAMSFTMERMLGGTLNAYARVAHARQATAA